MRKNYNNTRPKLHLPEYGRHIQEMVETLKSIEDRNERNRQAKAVIAVMGNINPLLRDTASFTHKLWDHLFIMSNYELDVDSPYSKPSRQELTAKPNKLSYGQTYIRHKHYGKYVCKAIGDLASNSNTEAVSQIIDRIARFMRSKSYEYNQEHPSNTVIIKDIKSMSDGSIEIDEDAINNIRSDYKQHTTGYQQKNQQRYPQRNQYKNRGQQHTGGVRAYGKSNVAKRNQGK